MGFLHNPDNRQGDGLKERTKGTELFRDFLRKLFCPRLHTSTPSPHLQSTRQHIQRTLQPPEAPGYSHPVFQHKSSKTLTQGMTTGLFVNAGKRHGSFHRLLQPGFKGMITRSMERSLAGKTHCQTTSRAVLVIYWPEPQEYTPPRTLPQDPSDVGASPPQIIFHTLCQQRSPVFSALATPEHKPCPAPTPSDGNQGLN
jgi:hypothetical protein